MYLASFKTYKNEYSNIKSIINKLKENHIRGYSKINMSKFIRCGLDIILSAYKYYEMEFDVLFLINKIDNARSKTWYNNSGYKVVPVKLYGYQLKYIDEIISLAKSFQEYNEYPTKINQSKILRSSMYTSVFVYLGKPLEEYKELKKIYDMVFPYLTNIEPIRSSIVRTKRMTIYYYKNIPKLSEC